MDSAGVFFRSSWDDCITKLENLGILLASGEINSTSIVTIVLPVMVFLSYPVNLNRKKRNSSLLRMETSIERHINCTGKNENPAVKL